MADATEQTIKELQEEVKQLRKMLEEKHETLCKAEDVIAYYHNMDVFNIGTIDRDNAIATTKEFTDKYGDAWVDGYGFAGEVLGENISNRLEESFGSLAEAVEYFNSGKQTLDINALIYDKLLQHMNEQYIEVTGKELPIEVSANYYCTDFMVSSDEDFENMTNDIKAALKEGSEFPDELAAFVKDVTSNEGQAIDIDAIKQELDTQSTTQNNAPKHRQ